MARTAIGLDIGHSNVRACAITRVGRDRLTLAGFAEVSRHDEDGDLKPLAITLAELDARLRLRGPVTVAVNDAQTLVRFINTLSLPPDRLARLLRLELSQHLDDHGDLAADSWLVPIPGDEMTHGCVLAQPGPLTDTLTALTKLGVQTSQVHYAPAAAYHATLTQPPLEPTELALLIDIGSELTGVTLIGDNRLLACRQVSVGAVSFAAAMAQDQEAAAIASAITAPTARRQLDLTGEASSGSWLTDLDTPGESLTPVSSGAATPAPTAATSAASGVWLNLDDDEPVASAAPATAADPASDSDSDEQLFIVADEHEPHAVDGAVDVPDATGVTQIASITQIGSAAAAPGAQTIQVAMAQLGPELTRAAETLYAQVYSTLHWFRGQLKQSGLQPTRVWLAGAGCGVVGLDVYFGRRFGVPVTRLDPFAGVDLATGRGAPAHLPDRPWEWTVAAGLALADPALRTPHAVPLDLRPETSLRRELWRSTFVWPYVAAVAVLLAAVVVVWTGHQRANQYNTQVAAVQAQQKRIADFKRDGEAVDKDNADLREDLRAIAARMYAGRDLLYAVRALKEEAVNSHELWVTTFETQGIASDGDAAAIAPGAIPGKPAATPAPKPAGGKLAGAGTAKSKWSDTTIDRGAIDISGKVRFDSAPAASQIDDQLRVFFDRWYKTISTWSPGAGQPQLFRDARVLEYIVKPGKAKLDGDFPWKVRLYFQPTQLDAMLSAIEPPAQVEAAKPEPAKSEATKPTPTKPLPASGQPDSNAP